MPAPTARKAAADKLAGKVRCSSRRRKAGPGPDSANAPPPADGWALGLRSERLVGLDPGGELAPGVRPERQQRAGAVLRVADQDAARCGYLDALAAVVAGTA
jgi:hypothetical protein